jgi:hypothetical protein
MTFLTSMDIVTSLAVMHSLHVILETQSVNAKVDRLIDIVHKKAIKPYPYDVDTRVKAYTAGLVISTVFFGLAFGIVRWFNPDSQALMIVTGGLLVVSELVNLMRLDQYHIKIELVMRGLGNRL